MLSLPFCFDEFIAIISVSALSLKAHSHGVIFSECDCVFFTTHGMGCMDVNDTVHIVRL